MFHDFAIAYALRNTKMGKVKKLDFQRQTVAYMLTRSVREVSHAAGNVEFDVTPVFEYGEKVIREIKASPGKLTPEQITRMAIHKNLSSFFLKAIAHTTYHVPALNGFFEWKPFTNGGRIYECEDINLCFTVHTPRGVMTPVIRNPHQKDIFTMANDMRELARKARRTDMNDLYRRIAKAYLIPSLKEFDIKTFPLALLWLKSMLWPEPMDPEIAAVPIEQRLQPEDVVGFTTVVANIGSAIDGWQTVTAIAPPSVFMWGIGHIRLLPRVIKGQIVPRNVVNFCVTFDHRALDGGHIFPFAEHMNRYFANPELIFNWKPGDPI